MLDDEDRERGVEARDELGDAGGLDRRHAGGRLVEKQHARALRERDGELELPALAVRERANDDVFAAAKADAPEHRVGVRLLRTWRRTKHAVRSTARGDRERDVVSRGER